MKSTSHPNLMKKSGFQRFSVVMVTPFAVTLGIVWSVAMGTGSILVSGVFFPVWVALWAFSVNWLAFSVAYVKQTEKFYDFIGSVTFISTMGWCLLLIDGISQERVILALAVCIWSLRLGVFLFMRINRSGKDGRFDSIKPSFFRFLNAWTFQGLWVVVCSSPVVAAISSENTYGSLSEFPLTFFWLGLTLWALGMLIESIADSQKSAFKRLPENNSTFIRSGLWSVVRHPNYLGEIVLWSGLSIAASPFLDGWQYITLGTPLMVYVLLRHISGIPLLEERAQERWGQSDKYEAYLHDTPRLIPSFLNLKSLFRSQHPSKG